MVYLIEPFTQTPLKIACDGSFQDDDGHPSPVVVFAVAASSHGWLGTAESDTCCLCISVHGYATESKYAYKCDNPLEPSLCRFEHAPSTVSSSRSLSTYSFLTGILKRAQSVECGASSCVGAVLARRLRVHAVLEQILDILKSAKKDYSHRESNSG